MKNLFSIQSIVIVAITLTMVFFSSCKKNDDVQEDKKANSIELLSGDNQTAKITKVLANQIEVIVKDQYGNAFKNTEVNFEAVEGSVSQTKVQTDNNGKAAISWTLADQVGTQNLKISANNADGTAVLAGSPIMVTATAICIEVGDEYAGGIVFYVDSNCNGLICAKTDQNNGEKIPWDIGTSLITGATGTAIGTGQTNTTLIVNSYGSSEVYAALVCNNLDLKGYTDWFLPSKEELNLMYNNLHQATPAIGNFQNYFYWNSTEDDAGDAWLQDFGDGEQYYDAKSADQYVRAVRAF